MYKDINWAPKNFYSAETISIQNGRVYIDSSGGFVRIDSKAVCEELIKSLQEVCSTMQEDSWDKSCNSNKYEDTQTLRNIEFLQDHIFITEE